MNDHLESVLYHETTILRRLDDIGRAITRDYKGKNLTVMAIMHGSLVFMADLFRRIHLPLKIECISVASYHGATESTGTVTFNQVTMPDLTGEHVLIVDDILDSGRTLKAIRDRVHQKCHPESVRICVLLDKKAVRAETVDPNYTGFEIGDEFVVGYGLDYNGRYRNLPLIGTLKEEYIEPQHRVNASAPGEAAAAADLARAATTSAPAEA